jgi:hypothetical protein
MGRPTTPSIAGNCLAGARVDGETMSASGVAQINSLATALGGHVSSLSYDSQSKKIYVGFRLFRENQAIGKTSTSKSDSHGSDSVGSVTIRLEPSGTSSARSVNYARSGLSGGKTQLINELKSLRDEARAVHQAKADNKSEDEVFGKAEEFRFSAETALTSTSGYLQSASLEIPKGLSESKEGKGPSDSLNISRGGEGPETTLTHVEDGKPVFSLQLATKTSIKKGLELGAEAMSRKPSSGRRPFPIHR